MISFAKAQLEIGKNHLIVGNRKCGKTTLIKRLLGTIIKRLNELPVIVIVFTANVLRCAEYRGITPYIITNDSDKDRILSLLMSNKKIHENYHTILIYDNHSEPDAMIGKDLVVFGESYNITNIIAYDCDYTPSDTLMSLFPFINHFFIYNVSTKEIQKILYNRIRGLSSVSIQTFVGFLRILSGKDYEFLTISTSKVTPSFPQPEIHFSRIIKPRSIVGVFRMTIRELDEIVRHSYSQPINTGADTFLPEVKKHTPPSHTSSQTSSQSPSSTPMSVPPPVQLPTTLPASSLRPVSMGEEALSKNLRSRSNAITEDVGNPLKHSAFTPIIVSSAASTPGSRTFMREDDVCFPVPKLRRYDTTNPFDGTVEDAIEYLQNAMFSIDQAFSILTSLTDKHTSH